MNPDALSRQAIRLAIRKSRKAGRQLTREDILGLRVQTVEPWKRLSITVVGLFLGALSFACYQGGAPVLPVIVLGICSLVIVACGTFGRRAYLDRELKKLTPERIGDSIITGIINGLT